MYLHCPSSRQLEEAGFYFSFSTLPSPVKFAHLKPTFSPHSHLLMAALIWSGVGIMLIIKALLRFPHNFYAQILLALLVIGAGSLKSHYILDRTIHKNIVRIQGFKQPHFIAAVYPPVIWLIVLAMIAAGVILKYCPLPTILLAFIYGTVGWGLLFSSRHSWRSWRQFPHNTEKGVLKN